MITLSEKQWRANYEAAITEANSAIERVAKLVTYGKEMGFDASTDKRIKCPSCEEARRVLQQRLDNQT